MSKVYNSDLQAWVEQFLRDKNISQAKAAPLMGISQTALSQYRRSIYDKGNIGELENKLEEFFRTQERQEAKTEKALSFQPVLQDYIPTSISEDVYQAIQYCQTERGMVVLHGDAGLGKTRGAEKFVQDHPNNAIYIRATPSGGTLNSIMRLIARGLHIPCSFRIRNKLDLSIAIRERLEGTNKILIIDEAQHLKMQALEELRSLSDPDGIRNEKGTGIVLIGNTEVYSRMLGKEEARFAQLFSRIKMNRYYNTRAITLDDAKKLFPKLSEADQKRELEFLHGICQSKWGVRGAINVYNNAVNNEDISYNGLYGMARTMGIGLV